MPEWVGQILSHLVGDSVKIKLKCTIYTVYLLEIHQLTLCIQEGMLHKCETGIPFPYRFLTNSRLQLQWY